jgi:hypothetical protein
MFARSDAYSTVYPRVDINQTLSIATTNGSELAMGTFTRKSGTRATLATGQTDQTVFSVSPLTARAFAVNYTITCQEDYRTGTLMVASMGTATTVQIMDDYVENSATGAPLAISLGATQAAEGSPINIIYTSTAGQPAQMLYSVTYLA